MYCIYIIIYIINNNYIYSCICIIQNLLPMFIHNICAYIVCVYERVCCIYIIQNLAVQMCLLLRCVYTHTYTIYIYMYVYRHTIYMYVCIYIYIHIYIVCACNSEPGNPDVFQP